MTVQVGIGLFTAQVPPNSDRTFAREYREMLDMVRLAETLGCDSAWVSEQHGAGDGYMSSLLPTLAAMAAATERIKLGTGVLLTPFHHPLRLAEDAAVVDLLSGGRLILGLGLGWREEEFRMFGVPLAERVRRTVETVEILRKAWTGERFSHEGKVYSFDRVKVTPAPDRPDGGPIPVYLGGVVLPEPDVERLRRSTVTGTPQEVAHVLRPFVEAFGTRSELHLIVRLHYPGMDFPTASRAMELFAERAMPALKGA